MRSQCSTRATVHFLKSMTELQKSAQAMQYWDKSIVKHLLSIHTGWRLEYRGGKVRVDRVCSGRHRKGIAGYGARTTPGDQYIKKDNMLISKFWGPICG
jgi:hypothetical protein